jgi:hypothetical protein
MRIQLQGAGSMPGSSGGSGLQTTSFDTPLQDIPEEGTPLRFSFPRDQCQRPGQSTGSSGGSRKGNGGKNPGSKKLRPASPAASTQQADQGDPESPEPGSGKSWLSQRLRWPVVPIYSDVGTGGVQQLSCNAARLEMEYHTSDMTVMTAESYPPNRSLVGGVAPLYRHDCRACR